MRRAGGKAVRRKWETVGPLHGGAHFCLYSISLAPCGLPVRGGKVAEWVRVENVNALRDTQ